MMMNDDPLIAQTHCSPTLLLPSGGRCGVFRAGRHDGAVPQRAGPEGLRHQPEGRGPAQAVALYVRGNG